MSISAGTHQQQTSEPASSKRIRTASTRFAAYELESVKKHSMQQETEVKEPATKQAVAKHVKATQPKPAQPKRTLPQNKLLQDRSKDKLPKAGKAEKQQPNQQYRPEKDTRPSGELTDSEFQARQASIEDSCGGKEGYLEVMRYFVAQNPKKFAEALQDIPAIKAAREQRQMEWMASTFGELVPSDDSSDEEGDGGHQKQQDKIAAFLAKLPKAGGKASGSGSSKRK